VQNEVPHCCVINAKALVLEWLDAVVVRKADRSDGSFGFITKGESRTVDCPRGAARPIWCRGGADTWGGRNWSVATAVVSERRNASGEMLPAGWMPTKVFDSQAIVQLTGLRNPCAQLDRFRPGLMQAVLGRDEAGRIVRKSGVMAVVIASGVVAPGASDLGSPAGRHADAARSRIGTGWLRSRRSCWRCRGRGSRPATRFEASLTGHCITQPLGISPGGNR
jgi:hypothetical protein